MRLKKILGIILSVGGIILFVLSLLADVIGIGDTSVFGWIQIVGIAVGAVAFIVGLILLLIRK